ncbi:MAG: hypothetical protein GW949_09375 [Spirochaetales bacterium]|nr:hypothetical protein [Spirochaetales bacterium]
MKYIVLLLLIFGSNLGAQTLMTKVYGQTDGWASDPTAVSLDSPTLLAREILQNFESGLMEALFSQGYICFNSTPELIGETLSSTEFSRVFLEAQEGGAGQVILLDSKILLPNERGQTQAIGRALLMSSRGQLLAEVPISPLLTNNAEAEGQAVALYLLEKLIQGL